MSIPDKNHKTQIKCYALKSNHIYCRIELNSVQGVFLIDSGASNSCIDIERQDKFKLDKFKKSYSASGAGSEKFDAFKTKKPKPFVAPEGIKFINIDIKTGKPSNINYIQEAFKKNFSFDKNEIEQFLPSEENLNFRGFY